MILVNDFTLNNINWIDPGWVMFLGSGPKLNQHGWMMSGGGVATPSKLNWIWCWVITWPGRFTRPTGSLLYIYIYIRHNASCEGVFSSLVAWTGLFSVLSRAPRISFTAVLGPSVFGVFCVVFEVAFLMVCGQHSPNMAPTWGPKRFQNR